MLRIALSKLSQRAGRTSQRSDTQRLATIYEISLRYQSQDIRPSPARPVIDTTSQYVKGEEYLTRFFFYDYQPANLIKVGDRNGTA